MIWILLSKKFCQTQNTLGKNNLNKQIIEWVRKNLQKNNFDYHIKFVREYIFESELEEIKENDYIIWNPYIASKNLALVQNYKNSIVFLEHQTYLNETVTKVNPINENTAVNYGFSIMYLNEKDFSTKNWKLAVQDTMYLIKQNKFIETLSKNPINYKQDKIERQDDFEDLSNIIKEMVNI